MENVKLLLSQTSQFHPLEKMKNKSKKRTRATLFPSSEEGKQENLLFGLTEFKVNCFSRQVKKPSCNLGPIA